MSYCKKTHSTLTQRRMTLRQEMRTSNRNHLNQLRDQDREETEMIAKDVFPKGESCYVDQQYLGIIKLYLNSKEFSLATAVKVIKTETNIFALYQACIGILMSMRKRENQFYYRTILQTGIIPFLSKMMMNLTGHPFLQMRAISILLTASKYLYPVQRRPYINPISFPLPQLMGLFESPVPELVTKGTELLAHIVPFIKIQSDRNDIPLLDILNCIVSNTAANHSQFVLQTICRCSLKNLGVNLEYNFVFETKVFNLLIKIVDSLDEKPISLTCMSSFLNWLQRDGTISKVCKIINSTTRMRSDYIFLITLFKKLHDLDLNSGFFSVKLWSNLMKSFAFSKQYQIFFWKILDKLQDKLCNSYNSIEDYLSLFEVYQDLIYHFKQIAHRILARNKIIQILATMHVITLEEAHQQQLNAVFFRILKSYPHIDISKLILQSDLLKTFVKMALNPLFIKNRSFFFNQLMQELQQLKNNTQFHHQYLSIASYMVRQGLKDLIVDELTNYRVRYFFSDMKKTEDQPKSMEIQASNYQNLTMAQCNSNSRTISQIHC